MSLPGPSVDLSDLHVSALQPVGLAHVQLAILSILQALPRIYRTFPHIVL